MDIPKNKIDYKMTNFNRVEIIKQDNLKNRVETRIQTKIRKNKKNKIRVEIEWEKRKKIKSEKIFLDSSPPCQPAEQGEGVYESKYTPYILGGKYSVFAICVRTQIDFCRKGGITAHSDNKTR